MDSAKSQKQTQIPEQIEKLDKEICVLSELVGNLMDRLNKVLRNHSPLPQVVESDKVELELVPMATSILHLNYRVYGINNDVRDILNRLEL